MLSHKLTIMTIDASHLTRIARALERLPPDMQRIALRRASERTSKVIEYYYTRFAARHLGVPQHVFKKRLSSDAHGPDVELTVKSTNIPLHEMNSVQNSRGVYVRGRGSYIGAFLADRSSKRGATARYGSTRMPAALNASATRTAQRVAHYILKRDGKARLPTHMLFGPNPANAIDRTPKVYEDLLKDLSHKEYMSVLLQQVTYLLQKANVK